MEKKVVAGAMLGGESVKWFEPSKYQGRLRKKLVFMERTAIAVVNAEPGTGEELHTHDQEQMGYVLEGQVEFKVGTQGEEVTLGPGDFFGFAPGYPHGIRVLGDEPAVFITTYSPPKDVESGYRLENRS